MVNKSGKRRRSLVVVTGRRAWVRLNPAGMTPPGPSGRRYPVPRRQPLTRGWGYTR